MTSKQRYTYAQLGGLLSRSDATINRKVKKYSLELDKDYVNGRLVNIVCLSDEELDRLQEEIQQEDEKRTSRQATNVNSVQLEEVDVSNMQRVPSTDSTMSLVTEVISLANSVKELAENQSFTSEQLGEYKARCLMIEDKEKQSSDDAKYWQNQYHEAQHTIKKLELELQTTREQLEKEQKRKFWQRNVF